MRRRHCVIGLALVLLLPSRGVSGDGAPVPHVARHPASVEIYFAPEDRPGEKVVALCASARHSLFVAMYGLTFPKAVETLVAAKRRGVDVRVLTDRERLRDPKQVMALETLRLAGIPLRINRHESLMHLKQIVIDDRVNTSGSMNLTASGDHYNDERLDVFTDAATTAIAKRKFVALWQDDERVMEWTGGPLSGGTGSTR